MNAKIPHYFINNDFTYKLTRHELPHKPKLKFKLFLSSFFL